MIERLLAADAALAEGELEAAGRLFAQVAEADPRNAIAMVGLARIAIRDGRTVEARELLARALEIDPDEAAAERLIRELYVATPAPVAIPEPTPAHVAPRRPSLLDRLRAWLAGRGRRA